MGDTRVAGERLAFDDSVWSDEVDRLTLKVSLTEPGVAGEVVP